tara:strand:- start:239 stop:436 length:198 start_codon:yes stop_codon:yes gene_type:complete
MKFIIIFHILGITIINPLVNAHENHDHQIYNWSNLKNKTKKKDSTFNDLKLEVIKNKTNHNPKPI